MLRCGGGSGAQALAFLRRAAVMMARRSQSNLLLTICSCVSMQGLDIKGCFYISNSQTRGPPVKKKFVLVAILIAFVVLGIYLFNRWDNNRYCTPFDSYWHGHIKRIYIRYLNQDAPGRVGDLPEALTEAALIKSLETVFNFYPEKCIRPQILSYPLNKENVIGGRGTVIAKVKVVRVPGVMNEFAFSTDFIRWGRENETKLDGPRGWIAFYKRDVTNKDIQLYYGSSLSRLSDGDWLVKLKKSDDVK